MVASNIGRGFILSCVTLSRQVPPVTVFISSTCNTVLQPESVLMPLDRTQLQKMVLKELHYDTSFYYRFRYNMGRILSSTVPCSRVIAVHRY